MMVPRSLRKGQKTLEEKKEDSEVKDESETTEKGQEPEDWASLTVSKLKEVCKELGLPVGGRKADIIKRIVDDKIARNTAAKKDEEEEPADNIGDTTSTNEKIAEDGGVDEDGVKWDETAETELGTEKENEKTDEAADSRTYNTVEVVTTAEAKQLPEEAEEICAIVKSISSQSTDEEDAAVDNRSEAEAEVEALLGGSDDERNDVESRKRTFDENEEDGLEDLEPAAKKQAHESLENDSSPTSIKIDNFVRPFTLAQARELVEQASGENGLELNDKTFFMNKIKTYAIVTLPTKECANKVIDALEGLQWPERSVKRLNAAISNLSALEATAEVSRHDALKALEVIGRPRRIGSSDNLSPETATFYREGERVVEREVGPGVVEREAQSHVAEQGPDKLFQKTTALPPLYWLPLSEEDASLKRVRIELEKTKASKKHQGQDRGGSTDGRDIQHSSDRSQDHERAISYSRSTDRSKDRSRDRSRDQSVDYSRDRSRDKSIGRGRRQKRSRSRSRSWRRSRPRSRSWGRGGYNRDDRHQRRGYSPNRFMSSRGGGARRNNTCYAWEGGNCRFGSNCRFYHQGSNRGERGSPPRRGGSGGTSRQPCRDYGRGHCRYGEDCKYLH